MRILFFIITILLTAAPFRLDAADYLAGGIFCGYRHDEGNTEVYPEMNRSTQKNIIPGAALKFDLWPFIFFRIGFSRTFTVTAGKVENNSYGSLDEWAFNYYSVPWHIAVSIPVEDKGRLYMGAGITYFIADGYIQTATRTSVSEKLFGYGLILGAQTKIFGPVDIFLEYEFLQGKTSPLADTDGDTYKDFPADISGGRISIGILYYFVRDES